MTGRLVQTHGPGTSIPSSKSSKLSQLAVETGFITEGNVRYEFSFDGAAVHILIATSTFSNSLCHDFEYSSCR